MVSAGNKPIREWTYRDIQTLSPDQQQEWRKVCTTELDMLKQQDVFELVDVPKGCKVINNHWVFDVKPDGHKHTRCRTTNLTVVGQPGDVWGSEVR